MAALLAVLTGGLAVWAFAHNVPQSGDEEIKRPLGLMTSLPIYWPEADGIEDMLQPASDDAPQHWVRSTLEENFTLVPLDTLHGDTLSGEGAPPVSGQLAKLHLLILAQPRTLVPADNVALDEWVRQGGRLLMFADPLLTQHSRFALGDKRRPQDVGLVPPVFARWGLAQVFDEGQETGERLEDAGTFSVPVNMRGAFRIIPDVDTGLGPGGAGRCEVDPPGLIARCHIGSGFVLLVADAALLEDVPGRSRDTALRYLTEWAFIRPLTHE